MEVDQNFIQDDKKWDRAWTTEEIRKNSANWTLAGDVGLYNLLTEFSQKIISRTHEVENAVDSLVHRTKMASSKINNIINDFHMLSNLQFVENRVYDEEVQETKPESKPPEKTKEQKEAEMLPKIVQAVELGLQVLDQAFNKISVSEISDSDDEELSSEGRVVLEPKDPYESRPLPFIIGTDEFQNSDYAGLQDLLDEDVDVSAEVESSISDSDETSTDEDEPLPMDEGKFTGRPQQQQAVSESDKFSSSEESELFGLEKDENGSISGSSFDSRVKGDKNVQPVNEDARSIGKESRTSSVSAKQSKHSMVQVLPVEKRPPKKKESSDLFANDEEASDDDSPFRKKTGLFTSDVRFDDDKDMFDGGDLFGETTKEVKKEVATSKPQPARKASVETVSKKKDEPDLFGNDEESDDDIFSTIIKTKAPSISKETKSFMKIGQALPGLTSSKSKDSVSESIKEKASPQDISDKTDTASTPSSALSIKSSGNAFDFTTGESGADNLFGDESDADDLFSSKKPLKKFDFTTEPDDEDDLFGLINSATAKKPQVSGDKKPDSGKGNSLFEDSTEVEQKSSLFEESTEVKKSYTKMGTPLPGLTSTKPKDSLFEEKKTEKLHQKIGQPLPGLTSKKSKDSLFGDSDSSEQEDKFPISSVKPTPKPPAEKKKEISLFDDDMEDDIFSQVPKKLMSPGESPSLINKAGKSQFDKLQPEDKKVAPVISEKKSHSPSLFSDDDDFEKDFISKPPALGKQKAKESSLFEDSDNFDLFAPKTEVKKTVTKPTLQIEKPDNENKVLEEVDGLSSSKSIKVDTNVQPTKSASSTTVPLKSEENIPSSQTTSEMPGIDLDIPPDNTSTLLVMNKDRAKITAKRRKPTKKGRQAALASSDAENPSLEKATAPSQEDSLFSEAPKEPSPVADPAITHKSQEKKKMNLMSQLMNEAAAKNFGKKTSPQPKEEEDEVDIFAEVANKDQSKSRGFSFHSPIESAVPPPDKENSGKEIASVWDEEDDDNEDFFSEPSFKSGNFRSSFSHKDSVLNLDDDDDDDLFSSAKATALPKSKLESSDPDIFGEDSDIFADLQKEKYEMFPSQVYGDEDDDDIFSSAQPTNSGATNSSSKATNPTSVKKEAEKKPVNVFEDPLTGLLGDN